MPGALERYQLPSEVKESLEELRELSKKAEETGTRRPSMSLSESCERHPRL